MICCKLANIYFSTMYFLSLPSLSSSSLLPLSLHPLSLLPLSLLPLSSPSSKMYIFSPSTEKVCGEPSRWEKRRESPLLFSWLALFLLSPLFCISSYLCQEKGRF
jgi:hypothetical protein